MPFFDMMSPGTWFKIRIKSQAPSVTRMPAALAVIFWAALTGSLANAQTLRPAFAANQISSRPNIVFILADDLGYGDLSCYGREDIQTPVLDALAKSGVRLTHCYSNGPECTPTRAAFLTGRYQQRVGGLECAIGTGNVGRYDDAIRLRKTNDLGLPATTQTIARLLKDAGYATAITGKWHLGYDPKFAPMQHGFEHTFYCIGGGMDYFHYLDTAGEYNLYSNGKPVRRLGYFTDLAAEEAISFIRSQQDRPFFLYVPYTAPHAPFQGPKDSSPEPLPSNSPLWNQARAPREVYVAMIEHMDKNIGRILQALDQKGFGKNTVVIFTSDNGGTASARNAPYSGIKGSTFEGGIRVPAIVRWPGVLPAGVVSEQVCATFDFTASIARIASVKTAGDRAFDGIDILAELEAKRPPQPRTLFWRARRGKTTWRAVRDGSLKLVSRQDGDEVQEYLFDLEGDPAEKRNLVTERESKVGELKHLLVQWEAAVRPR